MGELLEKGFYVQSTKLSEKNKRRKVVGKGDATRGVRDIYGHSTLVKCHQISVHAGAAVLVRTGCQYHVINEFRGFGAQRSCRKFLISHCIVKARVDWWAENSYKPGQGRMIVRPMSASRVRQKRTDEIVRAL